MQCFVVIFCFKLLGLDSASTHQFMSTIGKKRVRQEMKEARKQKKR